MTYIYIAVQEEDICDAMADDGEFCHEMWGQIAYRLDAGLLLDVTVDVFQDDTSGALDLADMLAKLQDALRSRYSDGAAQ